jgi:hypothetical protein
MGLGFHTRHVLYSSRLNSTTFASHGIAAAAAASAVHHEYSLHKGVSSRDRTVLEKLTSEVNTN